MWTIDEALTVIRDIQPLLHARKWHVALGGGVLNAGASGKDLDLYVMPFDDAPHVPVLPLLADTWGSPQAIGDAEHYVMQACYEGKWKFAVGDKRIDVFIGRSDEPEKVGAVDPHARSTGTLTTRDA